MATPSAWLVWPGRHGGAAASRLRSAVLGLVLLLAGFAYPASSVQSNDPWATALNRRHDLVTRGEAVFRANFTPARGLGPLYNETSCITCHRSPTPGGMGTDGLEIGRASCRERV